MESGTLAVRSAFAGDHSTRTRATALVAALLLVLGMFVLVQQVDAVPAGAAIAATAVVGEHAQINIGQLICSILIAVRNAFASTPFGGFVTPILNALINAFDCSPS